MTNLEIEQSHAKRPIQEVAAEIGIDPRVILPHGHHIAKIPVTELDRHEGNEDGALVLVTAMSPTPSGEGKTIVADRSRCRPRWIGGITLVAGSAISPRATAE